MPRPLLLALIAVFLLPVAPASAAERRVPSGWLGVVADGPLTAAGADVDGEWDLMTASGVESVRTAFYWPAVQPQESVPPDLSRFDALVLAAARRRLPVLPIVTGTPGWAATQPGDETSPPRDPALYANLLTTLVARYGPQGTLWAERPDVPPLPVRQWQVWNEPNLTRYWSEQPFARSYVSLLRAAHGALRAADPGAKVILAGLPNESWIALRKIYKAGGRRYFDAVALHPYTGKPRNVVRLAEFARRVMRRYHDGRKPIWITELSWPAAKGRTRNTTGFETTDAGQASRLRDGCAGSPGRASACGSSACSGTRGCPRRDRRTRSTTRGCGASAAANALRSGPRRLPRRRTPAAGLRQAAGRRVALPLGLGGRGGEGGRRRRREWALRLQQRVHLARGALPGQGCGAGEAGGAQPRAPGVVGQQCEQRLAQRLRLGLGQAGGAGAGLGQRGGRGREHRRAARHRLQHRQPEALIERREHERLGAPVEPGQQRIVDVAEQAQPLKVPLGRELRPVAACDDQRHALGRQRAGGRAQRRQVLPRGVGGDAEHVGARAARARRVPARGRRPA